MAAQQLGQKLFVDGYLAVVQGGQFALIVVHQNNVMAHVRKACPCNQSYASGTHDSDPHVQTPERLF
jgi:hypothetical protein